MQNVWDILKKALIWESVVCGFTKIKALESERASLSLQQMFDIPTGFGQNLENC